MKLLQGFNEQLITAQDGYDLHALQYLPPQPMAQVVVVHGRNECLLKYQELLLELKAQNFAVTVYDHRGQGFNQRLTDHHDKCHIDSFAQYANDLATVLMATASKIPTFVLACSMGCTVTLQYIKEHIPTLHLAGIILIAPFLGIKQHIPEAILRLICKVKCRCSSSQQWLLGKEPFHAKVLGVDANTSDAHRHNEYYQLYQTYPQATLGGLTNGWLLAALQAIDKLQHEAWSIPIPALFIIAQNDNMVSPSKAHRFVQKHQYDNPHIQCLTIPHSLHDILLEQDAMRQPAVDALLTFMQQFAKEIVHA